MNLSEATMDDLLAEKARLLDQVSRYNTLQSAYKVLANSFNH